MSRKVLFVTLDQMRGDALSCLGHPCAETPTLDALAGDGTMFTRHFAQASPCGPSRASLLTGLYQMNHRSVRNGTPLDSRHTNLALEARRASYAPVLFGHTDTAADPRGRPEGDPALFTYESVLPGFEIGCQMTEEGWPWRAHLQAKGHALSDVPMAIYRPVDGGAGFAGPEAHAPTPIYAAADSDTAFLTDQVLTWLGPRRGTDWFVHLSYLRPHPPLIAAEPWRSRIAPDSVPTPQRPHDLDAERALHPFHQWLHAKHDRAGVYTGHDTALCALPERELRQVQATYYGLIAEVDHHLGRIVAHLRATGEYEETLIVVTSDHGELLGDRWLFGKEGYFDRAFHVPLIVRDPGRGTASARDARVEAFTEAVDVMPTILDWLDTVPPEECDGRSLLPFLDGRPPAGWRAHAHFEFDFRDAKTLWPETALGLAPDQCTLNVLRGARYKYVHFTALPPLLFDLARDPAEAHNVAEDPAYAGVRQACLEALLSWRMTHTDRRFANTLLTDGGPVRHRGPRVPDGAPPPGPDPDQEGSS